MFDVVAKLWSPTGSLSDKALYLPKASRLAGRPLDQVSHPYNTTGRSIILYILIFKFLDSKLEDRRFCAE